MDKKDFKQFCEDNNLRYKKDACGDPISPSRKGLKTDQLYWDGTSQIGVCVEETRSLPSQAETNRNSMVFVPTKKATLMEHSIK